jgi:hypothetical protein
MFNQLTDLSPTNCSGNVASILSDGGAGTSSGKFFMQPGTYQVELYTNVIGCGQIIPSIDNVAAGVSWFANSSTPFALNICGLQAQDGIIASALIMQFGVNQILTFTPFAFAGVGLGLGPGVTMIFTKLQ